MEYVYPAIFEKDEEADCYCVEFPDIDGCFTQGSDAASAYIMAADALCLMLYDYGKPYPKPTDPSKLIAPKNGFISLVACDTDFYEEYYNKKAVTKTVTIPHYLDTLAKRANAPYSHILQEGLKEYLKV